MHRAFYHFIKHPEVRLIGCEAAGRGIDTLDTAATTQLGNSAFSTDEIYFCQDEYGQPPQFTYIS